MVFSGAVLTGGKSTRMGTDKAFAELGGRPMVTYALEALRAAGAGELLAIGGNSVRLERLGCTAVAERDDGDCAYWADSGSDPLAGIVRALKVARHDLVLVVGCDLPLVSAAAIGAVVSAAGEGPGAVASFGGRVQPVLGAYRRNLASVLEAAPSHDRAIYRAIDGLGLATVDLGDTLCGLNVNTPLDLAEAERLLRLRNTWPAGGDR